MPCVYLSHPEVVVDPAVPIEQWGLSPTGLARARRVPEVVLARLGGVDRIVTSAERKATDAAAVLATAFGLEPQVDHDLGELDRSATGYLPPAEFEPLVDRWFAAPESSPRGWERAVDAQRRTIEAVRRHSADGARVVFVGHGGVGALLLADLLGVRIDRSLEGPGMGSVFTFDSQSWTATGGWERVTV